MLLAALLVGLCAAPESPATGSCAAPALSVPGAFGDPPTLLVAGETTVRGSHFVTGCDDQPDVGLGCGAEPTTEEVPMSGVELTLSQGDRVWRLGRADAGTGEADRGEVTWSVRIPADVGQGPAVLWAGGTRLKVQVGGRLHLDRTGQ